MAVAPSVWPESCSTVVMEAMLTGRPVIATRIGGMTDLVVEGETGFLVPPGNVKALQYAIERLLEELSLRKEMGRAAQRKVVSFQVTYGSTSNRTCVSRNVIYVRCQCTTALESMKNQSEKSI